MYMKAPASLAASGTFIFRDGTVGLIDSFGGLQVPAAFVNDAEGAGFTEILDALVAFQRAVDSNAAAHTLAAAAVGGARECVVEMTGSLAGAAALTLPTVAALVALIPGAVAGATYKLRIISSSAGAFAWTVTTNTGWTLNGTMSIANSTWRDFLVTLNSLTTATLQQIGTGTNS